MSALSSIIDFFNPLNLDDCGGLLVPFDLKIKDGDYYKYRHLEMNPFIDSINSKDLPDDFSPKAVKLVDVFRRKTVDLDYEVMLIFDYVTSEILYCFVNDFGYANEVSGRVDGRFFIDRNIAVIHNHPKEFYSLPSARNFQILELEFEDYELVSSWDALWVLESKDFITKDNIKQIKRHIQFLYDIAKEKGCSNLGDEKLSFINASNLYGEFLMEYINNADFNIGLRRISK